MALFDLPRLAGTFFHNHTQCLNISKFGRCRRLQISRLFVLGSSASCTRHTFRDGCGEIVENQMYMEYKRTKSYNTGEASTGRAGVGGRRGRDLRGRVQPNPRGRRSPPEDGGGGGLPLLQMGLHLGVDTEFYRLTQSPEIVKIQMHWSQHPDKKGGRFTCFDPLDRKIVDTGQVVQSSRWITS